jgi:hypothetical protein
MALPRPPFPYKFPVPRVWNEVHKELCAFAKARGLEEPIVPLILAGWHHSSDAEKADRWKMHVEWAQRHGCPEITDRLRPQDFYSPYV